MGRPVRIGRLFLTRRTTYNEMVSCRPSWRHGRRSRNRIVAKCATTRRRAASRRPSAAQLLAKNRGSTMGATVTVPSVGPDCGMTRRSWTGSGSERRTAYLDPFLGGAGNPPQAASRVRASASQARTVASNGRYATSRGADTSGKQSRSRPFGRLRRRAESSRLMRSQAPPERQDKRAINLNGLVRHAGNLGQLPSGSS